MKIVQTRWNAAIVRSVWLFWLLNGRNERRLKDGSLCFRDLHLSFQTDKSMDPL